MAGYKVSYKILRQQGEDMKAVAKLVDGYVERVAQIRGKLGDDNMLAEVRNNLGKLRDQLVESRTALSTAGEFLVNTVENYTGVEVRQVKKVDGTKAHNRDFYKNPVAVASAGGASAPSVSTTTVNYTDNSVNVSYAATPAVSSPGVVSTAAAPIGSAPAAAPIGSASAAAAAASAAKAGVGSAAGIAAGAGVAGGAIGAGAVLGVKHLMDEDKKKRQTASKEQQPADTNDDYDPEAELEKAIRRVKDLEAE